MNKYASANATRTSRFDIGFRPHHFKHLCFGVLLTAVLLGEAPVQAEQSHQHTTTATTQTQDISMSLEQLKQNRLKAAALGQLNTHAQTGEQLLTVKHRINCKSYAACQTIADWGQAESMTSSAIKSKQAQNGIKQYTVDLSITDHATVDAIQQQAKQITAATRAVDGAAYSSWTGTFN